MVIGATMATVAVLLVICVISFTDGLAKRGGTSADPIGPSP